MHERRARRSALAAAAVLAPVLVSADAGTASHGPRGLGRVPSAAEVAARDTAIGITGEELPAGRGDVASGARLYALHCAGCHGAGGHEGPDIALVGGRDSLATTSPVLTIGSFWPYATTVFDYVRRAMPFTAPGSLTDDAVYALTAYLLHQNGIVAADAVLDRDSLPAVRMPNRDGFVPDPRPDLP